jgi:hypothetical protein
MKKGIYWFAFLSEQEQREFRINCDDFYEYMDSEIGCFRFFIGSAFDWIDTPQGQGYWREISKRDVQ